MKIKWNQSRYRWEVIRISDEESIFLRGLGLEPEFYDNTEKGDIFIYNRYFPVGILIGEFKESGLNLEIIY